MLRTIWVAFAALVVTIPCGTVTMVAGMIRSTSPVIDRAVKLWGRLLVRAAGIEVRTENMEALRDDRQYVLVANHYSYFDIPVVLATVPHPVRFMAKASLFKIPIFGWALNRSGFIPIDRKNRRSAVKSFDLAADRIRKGNTVVIFPEEGRTRERQMRPFQRGAFLLALKSEQPVLPIAIDGTYEVFPVGAWRVRPGIVTLRVGSEIPTAGLTLRDKDRLRDEARAQIESMLFGEGRTPVS